MRTTAQSLGDAAWASSVDSLTQVVGGETRPKELRAMQTENATTSRRTSFDRTEPMTDLASLLPDTFVSPVARVTTVTALDSCIVLQKWEGRVESLSHEGFVATLTDTHGLAPNEVAEFDADEVSPFDHPLISPGAIFYWTIGYRVARSGQRSRESVIRFRRLPRWTSGDRAEAAVRAELWKRELGWVD